MSVILYCLGNNEENGCLCLVEMQSLKIFLILVSLILRYMSNLPRWNSQIWKGNSVFDLFFFS